MLFSKRVVGRDPSRADKEREVLESDVFFMLSALHELNLVACAGPSLPPPVTPMLLHMTNTTALDLVTLEPEIGIREQQQSSTCNWWKAAVFDDATAPEKLAETMPLLQHVRLNELASLSSEVLFSDATLRRLRRLDVSLSSLEHQAVDTPFDRTARCASLTAVTARGLHLNALSHFTALVRPHVRRLRRLELVHSFVTFDPISFSSLAELTTFVFDNGAPFPTECLALLPRLEDITIRNCIWLNDLHWLVGAVAPLRRLTLDDTSITSAAIDDVATLPRLQCLCLPRSFWIDYIPSTITACVGLCRLILDGCSFRDDRELTTQLAAVPTLQMLSLKSSTVRSAGGLEGSTSLRELYLDFCPVSDDGLMGLENLATLEALSLIGCELVRDPLFLLRALPTLRISVSRR